jgi:Flp pilus assembly protein TadG
MGGIAAMEFAILLPSLLMLLVIATDVSLGVYAREQVQNAARAGSEFAGTNGYYSTGIVNAAVNSVSSRKIVNIKSSDVRVSEFCGCAVNGAIQDVTQTNPLPTCQGAACSTGFNPVTYASVAVTSTYTPLLPKLWLGLNGSSSISATCVSRTF